MLLRTWATFTTHFIYLIILILRMKYTKPQTYAVFILTMTTATMMTIRTAPAAPPTAAYITVLSLNPPVSAVVASTDSTVVVVGTYTTSALVSVTPEIIQYDKNMLR